MTNSITKYLTDTAALDQLSVTEIELMIAEAPSSSVYQMLLAKKMSHIDNQHIALGNNDRVMRHYLMENNGKIPSLKDLKQHASSQADDKQFIDETIEGLIDSEIKGTEIEVEIPTIDIDVIDEIEEMTIIEHNQNIESIPVSNEIKSMDVEILGESKKVKKSKNKKKNKFKLKEYSGISDFSKWLLSFKNDDVEARIRKEEKAAKKRALEQSAKKSVTKSPSIISEPLAEILANQGHLDDAKKMYEQLMQKYPEKSSYFAAKINLLIKT
jgi:hypothetical protein